MADRIPWLDLPQPLIEIILERLPLSDYVRFAAVCRRWNMIQMEHRHLHAPSPPPTLPLPWILPLPYNSKLESPLSCLSPLERKFYHLQLTPTTHDTDTYQCYCLTCSHGWLLLVYYKETFFSGDTNQDNVFLSLLNPVSGLKIQLPPLLLKRTGRYFSGAMSSPPSSPDCVVMFVDYNACWLFRLGDYKWTTKLLLNDEPCHFTYSQGKFYGTSFVDLIVVDPHQPTPAVHHVIMDHRQIWATRYAMSDHISHAMPILESNGEILLVQTVILDDDIHRITEFRVFKADLFENKWVRVKNLGDRALFLSSNNSFCLSATNIGQKRNCIYSTNPFNVHSATSQEISLFVFNLSTGRMTYGDVTDATTEYRLLKIPDNHLCWFIPSPV